MNLQTAYDRDTYLEFLRTFVPGFKQDIRSVVADKLQVTSKAYFLGESEDLDLTVFEITHSSSTDARVSLSMDGFRLMKTSATYRALIVYRSENSEDWRFSLMTATPDLDEKGKVVRKLSNPRRFSFFLGPNAKINTPKRFLIKEGPVRDFADLQNRFSLEVVNKEFYKQISEKFTQLVGGTLGAGKKQKTYESLMKLPSQSSKSQVNMQFGVRLIGRIIFCWFLREKKSKNNLSLMPAELLSSGAVSKNAHYYHSILEPIFFEVLNKEQRSRREEFSGESYSLIPYLNGGLFSPHDDDYYKRPNGEQSIYHNTLVIPDSWLKELFEILETYNFTIDENTSFDEELSIDPEMLGRIFENLLAEINPETGESARKSTGSYYTPRVIVDYMVDESLLLYLQEHTKILEEKLRAVVSYDLSDDAEHRLTEEEKKLIVQSLGKLKLLDPACGSGAFPIGALQKIVFILQQIDPDGKHWLQKQLENAHPEFRRDIEKKFSNRELDFLRKLGIIRECIFGVDIQPIATEIARLRCFLTLIVDERIDDEAENRGIKPLPNLDFKFVTANSLIDLPKLEETVQTQAFDNREGINQLKAIRDQYFNAYGIEREQLKTEFVTAQKRLVDQLVEEHGYMGVAKAELTQKLTNWEPFSHKSSGWFDPEWMFGISNGFDIVIANPPYLGEKGHKELFREIKKQSSLCEFQLGKMDLFYLFFHLAINLGCNNAKIAFITTNYYPTASGARKLREDFNQRTIIKRLINFNELKIFKSAAGQHNMISILSKEKNMQSIAKTCVTKQTGEATATNLENILGWQGEQTSYYAIPQDQLFDGEEKYIRLQGLGNKENAVDMILDKLKDGNPTLGSIADINKGFHSGCDRVTNANLKKIGLQSKDFSIGDGIFVLTKDEATHSNLIEEKTLHKCYKSSDIKRWYTKEDSWKKLFVIYTNKNTPLDNYPNTKNYLAKFRPFLEMKREFKNGLLPWFSQHWPRNEEVFTRDEKIILPYRPKENIFSYSDFNFYASEDVLYIFVTDKNYSTKYILALLNSKLYLLWLYHRGKRKGETLELYQQPLSEIPIKNISVLEQIPFIETVDKILAISKDYNSSDSSDKQSEIKECEEQIDEMVYRLYELTPEEIEIVEQSTKLTPASL